MAVTVTYIAGLWQGVPRWLVIFMRYCHQDEEVETRGSLPLSDRGFEDDE
jgi:hypothetical protein